MSNEDEDTAEFARRVRDVLHAGAENVDAHTRSRLTQARFAAVEAARRRGPVAWRMWMPLGGVVAAAFAMLLWSGGLRQNGVRAPQSELTHVQTPLEDLDLIAADENLEMVEDVEFYAWLDSDAQPGDVNGVG